MSSPWGFIHSVFLFQDGLWLCDAFVRGRDDMGIMAEIKSNALGFGIPKVTKIESHELRLAIL